MERPMNFSNLAIISLLWIILDCFLSPHIGDWWTMSKETHMISWGNLSELYKDTVAALFLMPWIEIKGISIMDEIEEEWNKDNFSHSHPSCPKAINLYKQVAHLCSQHPAANLPVIVWETILWRSTEWPFPQQETSYTKYPLSHQSAVTETYTQSNCILLATLEMGLIRKWGEICC